MLQDPVIELDLNAPRTVGEIVRTATRVYARLPLLFIVTAAIVVVPYELAVIAVVQSRHLAIGAELLLGLANLALVGPFIAAMQMQALLDLGQPRQQRPAVADAIRRGLTVLPVVAAVDIVAGFAVGLGLLWFILPGILIAVRWAVAAQVAAAERTNWPTALRRSFRLTHRSFLRVLMLVVISDVLADLGTVAIRRNDVATWVLEAAVAVLAHSFGTLLIDLLYFDLRAREAPRVA